MTQHPPIHFSILCRCLLATALLISTPISNAQAQTTAFTYQGRLSDNGTPATGTYDMQFRLFDNPNAGQGTQQGVTITNPSVQVASGVFSVQLDFGAAVFVTGASRYLEVSLRTAGSLGGYTSLAPRQQVTSAAYAVQSLNATNALNATTAANATQLGGVAASQYVITNDSRLSDARSPLPDSPDYVQNTTAQQASASFNIGGNGLIGGSLGLGTSGPSAKMHVHTTGLDRHLYVSSAAPSLVLGNNEVRSSATMNSLFALSTSPGHFGIEAGGLMIANYGDMRGNIYIDSNYSGNGVKHLVLQPIFGSVGIGTTNLNEFGPKLSVVGDTNIVGHLTSSSTGNTIHGITTGGIGVLGESSTGIAVYGDSRNGQYAGYFAGNLRATGIVTINTYAEGGGASVCRNGFQDISLCSSSLRYKTAIQPFGRGFDLIRQLRPISFTWKQDGTRDVGFGAEDVEKIEPLLVTYNPKGQVEGVKYDRITVALVNALREQQTQIEQQQQQIETLKRRELQFEALKRLVCADHPNSEVCKVN